MYTRTNPYLSRIKERTLLTGPGSSKKTYHFSLNVEGSGISYQVGDSIGILPENDPKIVAQIIRCLKASGHEEIFDTRTNQTFAFKDYLLQKANLNRVNTSLFKLLAEPNDLLLAEKKADLMAYLHTHTLLDLLKLHRATLFPQELCKSLLPLLPRFYSIASSQKVFPSEIHLTVAHVSYTIHGEVRFGVGTHFLCDEANVGTTPIPLYIQPSNHFTLPQDPSIPIIMIGPGTGVAPFRAFLQERIATHATGRNWLFFGERNRATDFHYRDFWLELESLGKLKLDLAFSRDQSNKIYVQHKMLEEKRKLWGWLQEGAQLYVCGDAEKMAKDVDATLHQIARVEGGLNEEGSRAYVKNLRAEKRYLLDVY
jgi:sulfite reductase (NADPH) flavoprotein alpha-component